MTFCRIHCCIRQKHLCIFEERILIPYNYLITDTRSNEKVTVCFEPLTQSDADTLKGEDWQGSRFGAVWKELAELEAAQKLTLCDGHNEDVLGIVQIGIAPSLTELKVHCAEVCSKWLPYIVTVRVSVDIKELGAFWWRVW